MMDALSVEDTTFTRDVVNSMHDDFQALEKRFEKRIGEYLRRRVSMLNAETQKEIEVLQNQHNGEVQELKEVVKALQLRCFQLLEKQKEYAHMLHLLRPEGVMIKYFERWKGWAERRLQQRRVSELLQCSNQRIHIRQCWGAWRLFSAAKVLRRRQEVLMRSRERQLIAETNTLKNQLEITEKRQKETDEQTKAAFLRGVSALNREALQVLRGEPGENETEAIASILRGDATISPSSLPSFSAVMDPPFAYSSSKRMHCPYYSPKSSSAENGGRKKEKGTKMGLQQKGSENGNPSETRKLPEVLYKGEKAGHVIQYRKDISSVGQSNNDLVMTAPGGQSKKKNVTTSPLIFGAGDSDSRGITGGSCSVEVMGVNRDKCPVQHLNTDGTIYHKCYAQGSASLSPRNGAIPTYAPLLLRVDPSVGVPLGLPAERKRKL